MRLWTVHPRYLDAAGLTALWREALLARKVLAGETRGYRSHPQLLRFRQHPDPASAIEAYLAAIHAESRARGYRFDAARLRPLPRAPRKLPETAGQLCFEWGYLLAKLARRSPELAARHRELAAPEAHPLFIIVPGMVREWERGAPSQAGRGRW
jgi:hypothetical protein